jgi:hypothetical protein
VPAQDVDHRIVTVGGARCRHPNLKAQRIDQDASNKDQALWAWQPRPLRYFNFLPASQGDYEGVIVHGHDLAHR